MQEMLVDRPHANTTPLRRLCLLGGESSGKTSLARALAARLGTVWVPEYGRQRWEELRTTLDQDELLAVARRQVELEQEYAVHARTWLVCDTTPLTTLQYCLHDHGDAPAELWALAARPYDLSIVCLPDFEFVQDGCRRDDGFRRQQHAWTLARLQDFGVAWIGVAGSVDERVRLVLAGIHGASLPGAVDDTDTQDRCGLSARARPIIAMPSDPAAP